MGITRTLTLTLDETNLRGAEKIKVLTIAINLVHLFPRNPTDRTLLYYPLILPYYMLHKL